MTRIRNPQSAIGNRRNPQSGIRHPKSKIRNPRSAIPSLLEVAVAVGSILLYLWRGRFTSLAHLWLALTYIVIVVILAFSFRFHHDTAPKIGLRLDNCGAALRISVPWLLLALATAAALAFGSGASARVDRGKDIWLYFPWGFAQQYFLQAFLLQRMKQVAGRRLGVLAAASLFALLHLPNAWLVFIVWAGAMLSIWVFERVPNLLVLGAEHALVAVTLLIFFKYSLLEHFAVGPNLQRFTLSGAGVRLAAWDLDGDGRAELIVVPAASRSAAAELKIFNQGRLWKSIVPFPDSSGGLEVAVGVLAPNPKSAIRSPQSEGSVCIAVARGPAEGNSDEVVILSPELKIIRKFPPHAVTYGVSIAIVAGRVLTAPGPSPGSKPVVEVRDAYGKIINVFALTDRSIANGARVTRGTSGSQGDYVLVTPQPLSTNPAVCFLYDLRGNLVRRFSPYQGLTYGMNCAVAHWDAREFLLFAPGPGRGYRTDLRVFSVDGQQLGAFEGGFSSFSASLAAGDWNGDGQDEVFLGAGINPDGDYRVRVLDRAGHLLSEWSAF
ncbi:MAG TPA: CPBP family glutamic-type intramembrane protease [Acidobacteriota bacterium]